MLNDKNDWHIILLKYTLPYLHTIHIILNIEKINIKSFNFILH